MANEIENSIDVTGNAEVMAFMENYVTALGEFVNDDAGLHAYLWPAHDVRSIDLTGLTGTPWFYIEDYPEVDNFYVKSAWGPCDKYVWGLYQQLAAIDPDVVVTNTWTDDSDRYLTGVFAYFAKDGVICKKEATIGYDELSLHTDYDDEDFYDVKFGMRDELFDAAPPTVVGPQVKSKQ
jgi:hypothetical protein